MSDETHVGGAELVQAAALEAIRAVRSFLDIAETVVREPGTAAVVGKAFADAAATAFRPPRAATREEDEEEPEAHDDAPRRGVRRINLTD